MFPKSPAAAGKLRIIGGQWRGRTLPFPDVDGLRPTGNRIRETLFNWLQAEVTGSHCLDLFAGSGALGLEALSRGAARCVFVERQRPAVQQLRANVQTLGAKQAEVIEACALGFLQASAAERCDLVFLDPPFKSDHWTVAVQRLENYGWLNPGASIYIETPANYPLILPANWRLHRQKRAGEVCYSLYRYETTSGAPE